MLRPMLMVAPPSLTASNVPAFLRARGGVRVVVAASGEKSAPLAIRESAGYRIRFVRTGEGVLINTGGGMAGGDSMRVDVSVLARATAVVTTQAAEKIYRSDGPETEVAVSLALGPQARLDWLPQEQLLFDGARFRRSLDVAMARDASLTLVESVVFGRLAMGETVETGMFRDRWRVRRDGRLVFAEDVRIEGDIRSIMARKAIADGARAAATVLHLAPDAERRCDEARALLADSTCECAVGALDGMLVARFLSPDPHALRTDLSVFLERFRGEPVPRSWQT
jgi:urease accessory protein